MPRLLITMQKQPVSGYIGNASVADSVFSFAAVHCLRNMAVDQSVIVIYGAECETLPYFEILLKRYLMRHIVEKGWQQVPVI